MPLNSAGSSQKCTASELLKENRFSSRRPESSVLNPLPE
jgi:hypothetical protein